MIVIKIFVDVLIQAVGECHLTSVLIIVKHSSAAILRGLKHGVSRRLAHVIRHARMRRKGLLGDMGHDSVGGSSLRASLGLGLSLSDGAGLATSLDALVAVLVVLLEVLKEVTVLLGDLALLEKLDKESSEVLQSLLVEVILMCLHIAKL